VKRFNWQVLKLLGGPSYRSTNREHFSNFAAAMMR